MPNETLVVALGICLPDNTWRAEEVEFPIEDDYDPDLPEEDTNRSVGDIAFHHWCVLQLPENSSEEDKDNAYSLIREEIQGYFVLHWRIKDDMNEGVPFSVLKALTKTALDKERTDRACDKDCARRLAGDDSVECTCSRSRQATEEATVFKVDGKAVKVGNDMRVEVALPDGDSLCVVLTHEGIIVDALRNGVIVGSNSSMYSEQFEIYASEVDEDEEE